MAYTGSKVRLTRKALLLAEIEATFNVDPTPSVSTDAVLVSEPEYSVDPNVLERNFVREDLSPLGTRIGRKLASISFGMELRSNGLTNSGNVADASMLGRLLRACGYSQTGMTGNGTVDAVQNASGNSNNPTFAEAGTNTAITRQVYRLTCVLGGASATAKIRVTGGQAGRDTTVLPRHDVTTAVYRLDGVTPTVTAAVNQTDPLAPTITIGGVFLAGDIIVARVNGVEFRQTTTSGMTNLNGIASALATLIDAHALITASPSSAVVTIGYAGTGAGAVITSGTTAITLGNTGMTLTPTWTSNLTIGDSWTVVVYPTGIKYEPVSDNFESITIHAYFDGLLHKVTGAFGTFSIAANAGEYGTINFTFTGQYITPIDRDVPSGVTHETSLPPVVELAMLTLEDFQPVVNAFTFDQNNTIVPRPDVSSEDGYNGTRITGRDPQGGIDPEATLGVDYDFWDKFENSTEFEFNMRIGSTAGNRISFFAPKVQYTGLTYGDRDGLKTYDAGLRFARNTGNDEFIIVTS